MTQPAQADSSKKAIRAGVWYTFGNFLVKGVVFLTLPIFTRLLTTQEFGDFNNFIAWMSLLAIISSLSLHASINRARFDFQERIDEFLSSIIVLSTLFTAVCYLAVISFSSFFTILFDMDIRYIHIMFITLLVSPAMELMQTRNRLFHQYKLFVLYSILSSLGSAILAIILVTQLEDKLFGRIFGMALPIVIINLVIFLTILLKGRRVSLQFWKYALITCVPLLPHLLAGNILSTSDRLIIQQYCGPQDLALYSLTYSVSTIVAVIWTSMNQAWAPWMMEKMNQGNHQEIRRRFKPYLLLFIAIAQVIILLAPEIVLVLGGPSYLQAKYVMPPVITGGVFQFAYSLYVNIEIYERKTVFISMGTVLAALINVSLNLVLIPRYGYMVAAYTTLFSYFLLMLFHYLIVRKLKLSHIYDNRFVFAVLAGNLVLMLAVILLYQNDIAR